MLTELSKLAIEFVARPLTRGREMRDLLEGSPVDFCSAAVELLGGETEERVQRYLVALLWTNNLLIPCLTGPATSAQKAECIAALASRVDPQLPAKLVGFVLENTEIETPECLERILVVLRSLPAAASFRPLLTPLLRHPDARIRAKAALLVGEGNRNRAWFERRMLEEDPRVRANAIESAGKGKSDDLRPLFRIAALDPNNRVAGNALIALYRIGEAEAVAGLHEMILRPDAAFRATAAWAMGETGDSRFLPLLGKVLTGPNETIKTAAFRAIRKLRNRSTAAAQQLHVCILSAAFADPGHAGPERPESGLLHINFAVWRDRGSVRALPATTVQIQVDGEFSHIYSVSEIETTRRIAAAFLLPRTSGASGETVRQYRQAIGACLDLKRSADRWSLLQFARAESSVVVRPETLFGIRLESATSSGGIRRIETAGELSAAVEVPDLENWPDFASAFLRLCDQFRTARASAQLFLLDPEIPAAIDVAGLRKAAKDAHVTVHAAGSGYREAVASICASTGGVYSVGPAKLESLPPMYRALAHRYCACVAVGNDVREVQLSVRGLDMAGESEVVKVNPRAEFF